MTLTAIFVRGDECYNTICEQIVEGDIIRCMCQVPHTILAMEENTLSSSFIVSAFANNLGGTRITFPVVKIPLIRSGYADGGEVPEPEPSIYEQIVEQLSTTVTYLPQSFTEPQKEQIRKNIGSATGGERTLAQTVEEGFVDLKEYTSSTNAFTTPCDGYLQIRKTGTSGTAYLHVDNYTLCSSTNGQTATIFCGQGMKVWVENSPTGASFIPWIVKKN